jgi:hypothetical protein
MVSPISILWRGYDVIAGRPEQYEASFAIIPSIDCSGSDEENRKETRLHADMVTE